MFKSLIHKAHVCEAFILVAFFKFFNSIFKDKVINELDIILKNKNIDKKKKDFEKLYSDNSHHPLVANCYAEFLHDYDPKACFDIFENFEKLQEDWEANNLKKNAGKRFIPIGRFIGSLGNSWTVFYYLMNQYNVLKSKKKAHILIRKHERLQNPTVFNLFKDHFVTEKNTFKFLKSRKYQDIFQVPLAHCLPFKKKMYPWFVAINLINQEVEMNKKNTFTKLSLSEKEQNLGFKTLLKMGLKENDWFVGLHIRQGIGNTQCNSDPSTYIEAIKEIISRGGKVIRLGDSSMTKFPKIDGLIDYPFTKYKSHFMDVFITQNCKFFLGTSSGPSVLAACFGTPVLAVNYTPVFDYYSYTKKDIFLPKKVHLKGQNHFDEKFLFGYPKGYIIYSESSEQGFDRFDIKDNSSEEIRNATIEMFDKLESKNTKKFLENNNFFKEKIKNIVKFDNKYLKCFADISSDFIESNIK